MIKSLSPYYITIPFASPLTSAICSAYTLQVFIWTGLKASVPTEPVYSITKKNPTSSAGNDKINIARLVNDYIDFMPQEMSVTGVYNGNNQAWVKTQVVYTTTNKGDLNVIQLPNTSLLSRGYSYGMDGENAQSTSVLLSGTEFKVDRNGFFCLPLMVSESLSYTVTVKSYPINTLGYTVTIGSTTNSSNLFKNIWVNVIECLDDTEIEINIAELAYTCTLLVQDECRYTPIDIAFQNKEGALQILTFFKAKTESLSVTSEEYENDRGQPNVGYHQYVTYNVQGKTKFKINSGFVDESINESYKQLLLSEKIWKLESVGNYTPLKLSTKSFEYKSRQKDRLINYELEFEYAFNEVNNI